MLSLFQEFGMARYELTTAQYRCVVAHMIYWERGLNEAIDDCGLPRSESETIIAQLVGCGYEYDEDKDALKYVA